jgi:hypothetical protein
LRKGLAPQSNERGNIGPEEETGAYIMVSDTRANLKMRLLMVGLFVLIGILLGLIGYGGKKVIEWVLPVGGLTILWSLYLREYIKSKPKDETKQKN